MPEDIRQFDPFDLPHALTATWGMEGAPKAVALVCTLLFAREFCVAQTCHQIGKI